MNGKQAAVGFIFVTVLIDIMGIGIIIPIIPELIQELTNFSNSESAFYGGLLAATYAVMQLVFAPILGGLSDYYGRRTLLLISLFGLSLDYLVIVFAPSLSWLFIARMISGVCGSSFTVANAYIADISSPEDRAKNFGMVGAAFGLGFIVGPTLGGVLGEFGTRVPFMAAAGITMLNWLYGYFVVPESLKTEHKRPFSWRRANPIGTLSSIARNRMIVPLLVALFFIYIASHATQSNWSFFAKEKFAWSPLQIGLSLGFVGIMVALVQGFVVPRVVKRFGEVKAVYTGFAFNALGLTLFSLISDPWMVYAVIVPFSLGGLAGPSLQSIMAGQTAANSQGELQGGLTQIMTITAIIGPPLMTGVFRYFTDREQEVYYPGAPFLLGAFLALLSIGVAYQTLSKIKPKAN